MSSCFDIKNPLPPLWLMWPQIERYSIGWRMGYGEHHRYQFADFWDSLSEGKKREYRTLFPEPKSWRGYWEEDEAEEDGEEDDWYHFENQHSFMKFWNPNGQPVYDLGSRKSIGPGVNASIYFSGDTSPVGMAASPKVF